MKLALYQPEIPQNTGTLLRTSACLGFEVHIIEPCGFAFNSAKLKRSGMDYLDKVQLTRHPNWEAFLAHTKDNRILLMDAGSTATPYYNFLFQESDYLLMGRESDGVPPDVAQQCYESITIPMKNEMRSLNMAVSAAIVMAHGLNQNYIIR